MADPNALYLRALSAEHVAQRLLSVAARLYANDSVSLSVNTNVGLSLSVGGSGTNLKDAEPCKVFLNRVRNKVSVTCTNAQLVAGPNSTPQIIYTTTDAVIATFVVKVPDPDRAIRAVAALEEYFEVTSYIELVRSTSPAVDQAAIQLRERSVADLKSEVSRLAEFLSTLAQRESEQRQKLQLELERSYREKSDELEKAYRERQAELDKRKQSADDELAKREKDFQERVAQFDMREARGVRRNLLKEIQDVLQAAEHQQLSSTTVKKRWPIHGFTGLLLAVSGALGSLMTYKVLVASTLDWHLLFPLAAGFTTFVTTLVYYLKWNDRWFREHADAEFAAKRYKADILRASWLAELVSEWEMESEGKRELPSELLGAYTRNLFRDVGPARVTEHPIDHLTAIMKHATEFDIGKGTLSVKAAKPEKKA